MAKINNSYLKLPGSYLFAEINKRINAYKKAHPDADIIRLGIGDVTLPLVPSVIKAMHQATDELAKKETFRGYGPEQGYDFLIEDIIKYDYNSRGVKLSNDEVFVSDGSKCDVANIQELFDKDVKIAIPDPVYPVYIDTNVMAGRTGKLHKNGYFKNIVYLPCKAENTFLPQLPKEKVDIIYLCSPNNPTGVGINKKQLKKWVDYAIKNQSIILFDAAYEAYITEPDIPHRIYEIPGAKKVAIEFRSYSKTAGFTGVRCAYTVVPKKLFGFDKNKQVSINDMWRRRQTTKFNGTSYITQRAAQAIYTKQGSQEVKAMIDYYMQNARIIREGLSTLDLEVYGGINAPYIWLKTPPKTSSWEFFDILLTQTQIVCTPGAGFGPSGENYVRLSAFGDKDRTVQAIERIKAQLKL